MQTQYLRHRHGGRIIALHSLGHSTYRGVASWYFMGHVKWEDGTESPRAEIAPFLLCTVIADGQPGDDECKAVLNVMQDYLDRHGEWHDTKHARDGRVYSWTPKKPKHEEPMYELAEAA